MNEAKLAVYIDFKNKNFFCIFWFSYSVIESWKLYKNISVETRIMLIVKNTQKVIMKQRKHSLKSLITIWKKIKLLSSQNTLKQVKLAQILVNLFLYMYENMKTVNLRTNEAEQQQKMIIFKLAVIWDQKISVFNLQNVLKTSHLRLFKEKHFLEIINRIHSLFQSLSSVFSLSQFIFTFESKIVNLYSLKMILKIHKLNWMHDSNHFKSQNNDDQSLAISFVIFAMFLILVWNKNWITRYIKELNEHINEYIDVNLFTMSKNCILNIDSRHYVNDEQWRNEIHQQLTLSVLRLNFSSILFQCINDMKMILSKNSTMLWTVILDWLKKLSVEIKIAFIYTLKMMSMNDYFFKYEDASLVIAKIIKVDIIENIVFKKQNSHINMKNASTDSVMTKTTLNDIMKAQKEWLKKQKIIFSLNESKWIIFKTS